MLMEMRVLIKWSITASVVVLSVLLRLMSWPLVITPLGWKFAYPDSYYHLIQTDAILKGREALGASSFDSIAAALVLMSGASLEALAATIPIVFFLLTIPAVYLLGRLWFGSNAGMVAIVVFALMPGEYLTRSYLGIFDHHVAEVCLSTWTMLAIAYSSEPIATRYRVLCIVVSISLFIAYATIWMGYPLFLLILIGYAGLRLVPYRRGRYMLIPLGFLGLLLVSRNWSYITAFYAGNYSTTVEASAVFAAPIAAIPILNIGLTLIALYYLIRVHRFKFRLLIVWTVFMILVTLQQRRFDYYLIVNMALLVGWLLSYVTAKRGQLAATAVALVLVAAMLSSSIKMVQTREAVPSDAWIETLAWIESNTHEHTIIMAWWDYGYRIRYVANRPIVADPNQEYRLIKLTADLFMSRSMPYMPYEYIILDYHTVFNLAPVIAKWEGTELDYYSDTFMVRLYKGQLSDYELVYTNDDIRVFRRL